MSGSVLWLVWMGAAAWLGRLNGQHAGSNLFAWAAAFGLLGGWLLWFIFDRYLYFSDLGAWFVVTALSVVALAGMGGVALLRTPTLRPWSAWAAVALLVLPLLLLLGSLVWAALGW